MAHEVETMAFHGEVPWHSLGNRVDTNATPEEMQKAAGLEWELDRQEIFWRDTVSGEYHKVPGKRAIIRSTDRKVMTLAGQDWRPVQPADLLGFFRDYAAAGGACLETAGSLRGGQVIWALADIRDHFTVGSDDKVKGYLLFISPNKVGQATSIRCTPIRVVCANTMAAALSNNYMLYSQNHLTEFNMELAQAAVEGAHKGLAAAGQRANILAKIKMDVSAHVRALAPFVTGAPLADELVENFEAQPAALRDCLQSVFGGPGADPTTAWGTYNGFTHWADHVNGRSAASRMFRSWVGDIGKAKGDLMDEVLEMA